MLKFVLTNRKTDRQTDRAKNYMYKKCYVTLVYLIILSSFPHRLQKLRKLLHAILALDQSTISEIRSYSTPPPAVHTVMMATLLLLGKWKHETCVSYELAIGKKFKYTYDRFIFKDIQRKISHEQDSYIIYN